MNTVFNALPVHEMARTGVIRSVKPLAQIGSEDSAVHLLKDFSEHRPPSIDSELPVPEARLRMKLADTSIKLVEDPSGNCLGVLTIEDVSGEKPLTIANRQGVALRDLRVRDIMRPLEELPAIRYRDLKAATVGDLVSTFQEIHEEYLLVLDADRQQPLESYLRGLVDARELRERLNLAIDLDHRATKFYEIVNVVQGGF